MVVPENNLDMDERFDKVLVAMPTVGESRFPQQTGSAARSALVEELDGHGMDLLRACGNAHVTSAWIYECVQSRRLISRAGHPSNRLDWLEPHLLPQPDSGDPEAARRTASRAATYRMLMEEMGGPSKTDFYDWLKQHVSVSPCRYPRALTTG